MHVRSQGLKHPPMTRLQKTKQFGSSDARRTDWIMGKKPRRRLTTTIPGSKSESRVVHVR